MMTESAQFRIRDGKLWYGDAEIIVPSRLAAAREQVDRWNCTQLGSVIDAMKKESSLEADQRSLLRFLEEQRAQRCNGE